MEFAFIIKFILTILLVFLLIKIGCVIRNIFLTIATPYNVSESIYWLIKYATGPSKKNAGIVETVPHSYRVNKNITSKYTLAFAGDIMPTDERFVDLSADLKEFLSDSDYFVANFEGIITEWRKRSLVLVSDRRHSKKNHFNT